MIKGVSSMATRAILADLARAYESAGGEPVAIESMGGVDAARLVKEGAAVDIVILASPAMAELEAEGHLVAGSVAPFALSGMALAVRTGTPWPDISSERALADAVAAAGRVGYSTGPSGRHLLKLCDKWGLRPGIDERMVEAPPGIPVGALLAKGEVDLAFQQRSELMNVPGIEIVGALPGDAQALTIFSAGISRTSQQAEAVQRLIDFLNAPAAEATKLSHGMEAA